MTQIRILRDNLYVGNRKLAIGDIVQVSEIGAGTAQALIEGKRAEAVDAGKAKD